jgi:glycosyltransferase involved in cell wall biosynthesis
MTIPPATWVACTAVTAGTARAARVLVTDLRRVHPDVPVVVLDLDGSAAGWTDAEVLRAEDVLDLRAVHHAVALRGVDDALAWLRPLSLVAALERAPAALWLDPTSLVLGPLDDVPAAAAPLAVVRRCRGDLPDDGARPGPADLAAAGRFSTSVLAATRDALPEMRAWVARAHRDRDDDGLDGVLARVAHVVLDDDGLAVSTWSLAAHPLVGDTDAPRVGDIPVRHLDLAGFDPDRPWLLDATLERPRVLLSEHALLAALLRRYAASLAELPETTSPYARPPAGAVDRYAWEAYRIAAQDGPLPPDPFDEEAPDAFRAWLLEPVDDEPALTRYLLAVHRSRPDLQTAFPQVPGADLPGLLTWAARHGRAELDPDLVTASLAGQPHRLPPGRHPTSRRAALRRLLLPGRPGVNVVGYLRGELGIGESARQVLRALGTTPVRYATTSVAVHLASRENADFSGRRPPRHPYDTTLICVNADLTPAVAAEVPELVDGRYRIGMWYWEVEEFSASLHGSFDAVDEVWVATEFVRDAVARHSPVPVHVVPPPLPTPRPTTSLTRADLGLPEGFVFLFSFDYLSTAERKNPWGLVEAFRRAFPRGSGPTLVIKTINADARPDQAERLRLAVADEPDVVLLERYLDADARDALTLLADCYVSLHRAEGLGLTMAEAMALGKPVIATAYGGNLQFMTDENSWLVPAARVPIPDGCEPYPPGTPWGDPDLDAAAAAMRAVVADPAEARARGARAAHDIATLHSPAVAGARMAERLAAARRSRRRELLRTLIGHG